LACAKEKLNEKTNDEETPIVKFGLDVHADQITVCRMLEGALPQPAQKMNPLKALSWIAGHVKEGFVVKSCYEAGPCGFWLHRALTAKGVGNVVVAPQRWDDRGKRVKTDKRDARELTDRLERFLRGNTNTFSLVRVPTPEQEEPRSLARQRGALLKERNRLHPARSFNDALARHQSAFLVVGGAVLVQIRPHFEGAVAAAAGRLVAGQGAAL